MGWVDGFKPCQPVIRELGNKGGDFFKTRVRTGRVGEHRQTVGLGDVADYFVCLGFDMLHKGRTAALEVAAEGVLGILGPALLDKQAGEVGAAYLVSGNLGQLLAGYGDAKGMEAFQNPLIAVASGLLQPFDKGEEAGMFMVEAVAQNMERKSIEVAAYLYSRENFNPCDFALGKGFVKPRDGVVIGQGDGCESPAGGKSQQGCRGQQSVRTG